jgi:cell division protein FtsW
VSDVLLERGFAELEETRGGDACPGDAPASASWTCPSVRLTVLAVGLSCFGLVMVASAAGTQGFTEAAIKRLAMTGAGFVAFFAAAGMDYHWWRRHNMALAAGAMAMLVAVLLPGVGAQINGAQRWINPGLPVGFQPSEFAKLGLIAWTAAYCERNAGRMRGPWAGFLLPVGIVGTASLLVLAEPDFGTAVLTGAVCTAVLVVFGTRLIYLLFAGAAAFPLAQKLVFDVPYRMQRIVAFLDPWQDPQGSGYQLIQSKIAIGTGGLLGRGLGAGLQKAGFLPGADNDFIFSIICEELGLIGALGLIIAFIIFLWEAMKVVMRSRDPFAFGLSLGLAWLIGMQAAAHIAVVTGSIPTKGLSLPFISAGGSSLIVSMAAAGILVSIARAEERLAETPPPWHEDVPGYEQLARRVLMALPLPYWARPAGSPTQHTGEDL